MTISNQYCEVDMTSFTSSPVSLELNNLIIARVKAFNVIGDGAYIENSVGVEA